ncbi:hypothetical protein PC120_g1832 [Phytophthora cactorum]|nr:hypothetical protein PC120_g1832 [Phytophthora cactorum]
MRRSSLSQRRLKYWAPRREYRRLIEEKRRYPDVQKEEPSNAPLGNKSMTYQGYSYAWYYIGASSTNYWCSVYRQTSCKAKLFVTDARTEVSGMSLIVRLMSAVR